MATSKDDIREWLREAKSKLNCTHMIIVCDTFDYDDYPVFVLATEDINEQVGHYNGPNMQKVMEVYKLSMDLETQIKEHRAWNI